MKSLRKKDQPAPNKIEKDSVENILIKYPMNILANEFSLANPGDQIGIWDKDKKVVRPIGNIEFNSDLGVYILYPDNKQEFIAASIKARKEEKHGQS